ncbi:MAG: SGNH/GDSL hydrolase family protein [Nodosilinea sp.]
MTISFLGDSLLDTGNLTNILDVFGITPFPDPPYSAGKASNGLVLGEAVIEQLGIAPDTLVPGFRLPTTPPVFNPFQENINYAVAGATTGVFGSRGNDLEDLPIGLQTQVALFKQDIASNPNSDVDGDQPDTIINAGSNDVFEALVDLERFASVLLTPEKDDDNALSDDIATQVVANLNQAVNDLEGVVDNIVIFGLSKLGDTPFSIQVDSLVDDLLPGDFSGQTRAFLTSTAAAVNARLIDTYNDSDYCDDFLFDGLANAISGDTEKAANELTKFVGDLIDFGSSWLGETLFPAQFEDSSERFIDDARDFITGFIQDVDDFLTDACDGDDVENVLVIDGIDVFERGLDAWIESLPENLSPVIELSYRDYLTQLAGGNPNNLPVDLVVEQFAFTDGSHPTSDLNMFLAKQAAPLISAEFLSFGQG